MQFLMFFFGAITFFSRHLLTSDWWIHCTNNFEIIFKLRWYVSEDPERVKRSVMSSFWKKNTIILSSNFWKFIFRILIVSQYRSFHKEWKTFWTNQHSQVHLAGPLAISSSAECTGGYRFCPWWYEIRSLSTLLPWYGNFSSRNKFENFNLLSYLSQWFLLLLYNPH